MRKDEFEKAMLIIRAAFPEVEVYINKVIEKYNKISEENKELKKEKIRLQQIISDYGKFIGNGE